jgi:hypothetical protein
VYEKSVAVRNVAAQFHFFNSNEEVETVVREWLGLQEPDLYRDGYFKILPRWE